MEIPHDLYSDTGLSQQPRITRMRISMSRLSEACTHALAKYAPTAGRFVAMRVRACVRALVRGEGHRK